MVKPSPFTKEEAFSLSRKLDHFSNTKFLHEDSEYETRIITPIPFEQEEKIKITTMFMVAFRSNPDKIIEIAHKIYNHKGQFDVVLVATTEGIDKVLFQPVAILVNQIGETSYGFAIQLLPR